MDGSSEKDLRSDAHRQLKEALADLDKPPSTREGERCADSDARFGTGMLILAVFTLVLGIYPLSTDTFGRVMFLCFAFILACVGAFFLDRAQHASKSRSHGPRRFLVGARRPGVRRVK